MRFRAALPAKGFFAQIGDFPMNVKIQPLEIVQLGDQFENLRAQNMTDLEWHGAGIFIELPDFIRARV